jgi:hypothetical protein
MLLTPVQIYAYATAAGFSGSAAVESVAVALAESGGSTTVVNSNGSNVGLWQIGAQGTLNDAGVGLSVAQLQDPATNARAAYEIWARAGGSFAPDWTTATNGAAAAEVPKVQAAGITGGQGVGGVLGGLVTGIGTAVGGLAGEPVNAGSIASTAGSAVSDATGLATGGLNALEWLSVPANWGRIALVGLGAALVIAGLVAVTRPVTKPVTDAAGKVVAAAT